MLSREFYGSDLGPGNGWAGVGFSLVAVNSSQYELLYMRLFDVWSLGFTPHSRPPRLRVGHEMDDERFGQATMA